VGKVIAVEGILNLSLGVGARKKSLGRFGFMEKIGFDWVFGFFLALFLFGGCSGPRPANLGVKDSRLSACPSSPNCVSSQSAGEGQRIEPLRFQGEPAEALERLRKIVRGMARTVIAGETPSYLHAEFRTFLGFVDDVEFYIDAPPKTIHLRSASRVGYWDLGANRRRMESIRAEFEKK
jgi:uncharacterized protein (DUF1499 family)